MKCSGWRQPVWLRWEILRISTFLLGFVPTHWMWLKGNAGLQFLHQQNGDNISTYASHFKWKALHSCKIALSCQYTTEFFTFCLEHFIQIPPHMEQNEDCRLQKMWFFGSWQCHLHLCVFAFQTVSLGNDIRIIWWLFWTELTAVCSWQGWAAQGWHMPCSAHILEQGDQCFESSYLTGTAIMPGCCPMSSEPAWPHWGYSWSSVKLCELRTRLRTCIICHVAIKERGIIF